MLVTHDMGVIAETADRVAVMYAGKAGGAGAGARKCLRNPRHPYTDGLMGATPAASAGRARLHQIPGAMPRLGALPTGCAFHPRCPKAQQACRVEPGPTLAADGGRAACWFPGRGGRRRHENLMHNRCTDDAQPMRMACAWDGCRPHERAARLGCAGSAACSTSRSPGSTAPSSACRSGSSRRPPTSPSTWPSGRPTLWSARAGPASRPSGR